jgi:TatA/E family protein of Tat protein translocase
MFGSIGMPEMVLIFVIALIIFGPKKLPGIGTSLGKAIGEFKRASTELRNTLEQEVRLEEQKEQQQRVAALGSTATSATPSDDFADDGSSESDDVPDASSISAISAAPIETPADLAAATADGSTPLGAGQTVARGTQQG